MKRTILLLFLVSIISVRATAQDVYEIQRSEGPITLDGIVDEMAWDRVEPLPLTMYTPTFQGQLSERTEIKIIYDDSYIYASAKCYDSDPDGVQGPSLVRDIDKGGDFFNILLDTFNDNENFVTFSTTPSGNRLDAQITNDAEGGQPFFWNSSWNGFWNNAVTKTEHGWFAEMRIPFSSLRFEDDNGEVVFGLIVHRRIGRKNERQIFPSIPPNWEAGAWKPSQAQKVVFKGIKPKKALFVTPYVLSGYEEKGGTPGTTAAGDNKFKGEAGLDIKYGVSNNFNLDLTINTDFAQVEADDQQVNLSRFSLFFPEKRQFFQERSGIFRFTLDDQDRLFHSRAVGIAAAGSPIRLYGGLRLTGRVNTMDIGLLNAQTASHVGAPTENFGVIRLRQRVFNRKSFIGGILTSRISAEGSNITYGLDGVINLKKTYFLTLKAGQSLVDSLSSSTFDKAFTYAVFENRAVRRLGYKLIAARNGVDFNPGIGFRLRNNFTSVRQDVWYGFFQKEQSILRVVTPSISNTIFYENAGLNLETQKTELSLLLEMKSGTILKFSGAYNRDNTAEPFQLSNDIRIPSGDYEFTSFGAAYTINDGRLLRFSLESNVGRFYNGDRVSVAFSPFWNVSPHFDVAVDYLFNQVKFSSEQKTFRGDVQRLRVNAALNSKLSLNSLLQYNRANDTAGVNLRCRYNFREGNDLFVVYNYNVNTDNELAGEDLINRSVLVKYTYTFIKR